MILITRDQLYAKYVIWAERYRIYPVPDNIDNASLVFSFASGITRDSYSGTNVYAIGTQVRGRIHLFVFLQRTTWRYDSDDIFDTKDTEEIDVEYRHIVSF